MKDFNRKTFYDAVRPALFKGALTQTQVDYLNPLLNELASWPTMGVREGAYILATAFHETDRFRTMVEYADGTAYEGRKDLGNDQPGDGPRFKGRGYVQLTGRRNYQLVQDELRWPLIDDPHITAAPKRAAHIIVRGMFEGWFTGRGLDHFNLNGGGSYVEARRIVNGDDKALLIAGWAEVFEKALQAAISAAAAGLDDEEPSSDFNINEGFEMSTPGTKQPVAAPLTAAGAVATSVWALLLSLQVLPPELQAPETAAAVNGVLTTGLSILFSRLARK